MLGMSQVELRDVQKKQLEKSVHLKESSRSEVAHALWWGSNPISLCSSCPQIYTDGLGLSSVS